jgi:multiple sugar transport system ATP-binding protein
MVAEHLGSDTFLHVDVDGIGMVTARSNGDFASKAGDTVYLTPDKTRIHKFNESGLAI